MLMESFLVLFCIFYGTFITHSDYRVLKNIRRVSFKMHARALKTWR